MNRNSTRLLAAALVLSSAAASAQYNSTTATTPQQATGTTTATAPTASSSPLGRFTIGATFDMTADDKSVKNLGSLKTSEGTKVESVNYLTAGYKLSDTDKLSFRQYWTQSFKQDAERTDMRVSWLTVNYSTKWNGILGSKEFSPMFWYYIPTGYNQVLETGLPGGDQVDHYGIFRLDAEIPWELSPKWTASLYLNPRQRIISGGTDVAKYKLNKDTGAYDISEVAVSNTELTQYAYLYYNFTDSFQVFGYMGARVLLATSQGFENFRTQGLPGVGLNWDANKNITLSAEINQEVMVKNSKYNLDKKEFLREEASNRYFDSNDYTYELILALRL